MKEAEGGARRNGGASWRTSQRFWRRRIRQAAAGAKILKWHQSISNQCNGNG